MYFLSCPLTGEIAMTKKRTRKAIPSDVRKSWREVAKKDQDKLFDLVKRLQAELAEYKSRRSELEIMFKEREEERKVAIIENGQLREQNRTLKEQLSEKTKQLDCEKRVSETLQILIRDIVSDRSSD
jgi:predicted GIY-YIG superfamily endonuclease